MRVSAHISDKEAFRSLTAIRLGIDNTPTPDIIKNVHKVAQNIFEPLRGWVGKPICINSFYRSPELNKAIGGSSKSQHCKGQAIDIDDKYGHKTNAEMFDYIKKSFNFDQMIWEFGNEDNPDWVHVSYVNPESNRNRCLQAYRENGKTKYKVI